MGQVGCWGPSLALLGLFMTPLGLSVGPNVCILSFWRYQNHLEPYEKWSEDPRNVISYKNTFLRKMRGFDPKVGLFAHKLSQNGVHWGGLQGQCWGFEGPRPFGSRNNANKKNLEKNFRLFWPKRTWKIFGPAPPPKNMLKIGPQGPSRVLGAIFGPSGTLSDLIGALSGS